MNVIPRAKPKTGVSVAEMERRREALRQADASNRIEGFHPNPAATAVYDEFIRGEIDLREVWPRIQALQPRF